MHMWYISIFTQFAWSMIVGVIRLPSQTTDHETKPPDFLGMENLSLLVRGSTWGSQTIALGPEPESNTPFLKTQYTSNTEVGGSRLDLTWKLPSWGLTLIESKGAMQAANANEGKQSIVLQSCKAWEQEQWPEGQDVPKYVIGEQISWKIANNFLIGLNSCSRR